MQGIISELYQMSEDWRFYEIDGVRELNLIINLYGIKGETIL